MNKYLAELLGTFWLVLGGCGSAVLAAAFPDVGIGLLGVSLAFGLTVLTMAFAIGHIGQNVHRRAIANRGQFRRGQGHLPHPVRAGLRLQSKRPDLHYFRIEMEGASRDAWKKIEDAGTAVLLSALVGSDDVARLPTPNLDRLVAVVKGAALRPAR